MVRVFKNNGEKLKIEKRDLLKIAGMILGLLVITHGIARVWGQRDVRLDHLEAAVLSTEELHALIRGDVEAAIAPLAVKIDGHIKSCDDRYAAFERAYQALVDDHYERARGAK